MRQESELRPYQERITTHLYEHNEAFCVVRPGGGKTAAALTAITELLRDGIIRHALVIAPKRVATTVWPDEIEAWAHCQNLSYTILTGSPNRRQQLLKLLPTTHITIIGIDLVYWLINEIAYYDKDHPIWDLLVIDEISKLREPTGVRAKLLAKTASCWKMIWGLSGTLRPNGPLDLFMPARIVTKGRLWGRSFYKWRQTRFYPTDYHGYDWALMPGQEDQINAEIAPLVVSLREDEYPQLPELSVIIDRVELPVTARRQYQDMHRALMANFKTKTVIAVNSAVATGKLAQIANGFVYSEGRMTVSPSIVMVHDEKREWLQDIVENATGPTLLVYEYQQDLKMIRDIVGFIPYLGSGLSDSLTADLITQWNAGKVPFMAIHPAAAGHGLNLQAGGADMAWIAPTWSPELWEQTIARLHRSGQTRPVIVRVCVARDTVDQMKLDRVYGKISAQQAFEDYLVACSET